MLPLFLCAFVDKIYIFMILGIDSANSVWYNLGDDTSECS